jgi:hypothetical protein
MHIEVLNAGWDNWVLSDVDPSGTKIITTPHGIGPLLVQSFPSLEILRSIDPPPGMSFGISWRRRMVTSDEEIPGQMHLW